MPPRSLDTTELTWPEVRDAIAQGYDTVVIAAGSIEQHGPHLPEMTDTLIGTHLVRTIVERVPNALQGPTITIGCSEHHMSFAGTVALSTETFVAVVRDVARSRGTASAPSPSSPRTAATSPRSRRRCRA